jgi:hypothetical protein
VRIRWRFLILSLISRKISCCSLEWKIMNRFCASNIRLFSNFDIFRLIKLNFVYNWRTVWFSVWVNCLNFKYILFLRFSKSVTQLWIQLTYFFQFFNRWDIFYIRLFNTYVVLKIRRRNINFTEIFWFRL